MDEGVLVAALEDDDVGGAVVGVVADEDDDPEAVAVAICGEMGEPGGVEVVIPDVGIALLA